jgi:hypothetical protein
LESKDNIVLFLYRSLCQSASIDKGAGAGAAGDGIWNLLM